MARRSSHDDESGDPRGFAEALGRTIKVLRTDLGIERRDLAERAGISYSYLTEIENGNKPPSSSVLGPIAAALGLRRFQLTEAAERRMDTQEARVQTQGAQPVPASPSVDRTELFRSDPPSPALFGEFAAMRPSLRGANRDLRAAVLELERLVRAMAPEDVERLLDYARRLAR